MGLINNIVADVIVPSLPKLASGMVLAVEITIVSLLIAIAIGLITCLFAISKLKILNWIAGAYVYIIRGTPLLVQLFFIYFGITKALGFNLTPLTASIITISLNAGAYISEIFRGGILSVSNGQMEAARSLGLPYGKAMIRVILPQAVRVSIPAMTNQAIITLKDTSLLSAIGVPEIFQNGKIIIGANLQSTAIWATVGIMYLIVVAILSKISKFVERSMSHGQSKGK